MGTLWDLDLLSCNFTVKDAFQYQNWWNVVEKEESKILAHAAIPGFWKEDSVHCLLTNTRDVWVGVPGPNCYFRFNYFVNCREKKKKSNLIFYWALQSILKNKVFKLLQHVNAWGFWGKLIWFKLFSISFLKQSPLCHVSPLPPSFFFSPLTWLYYSTDNCLSGKEQRFTRTDLKL